MIGDQGALFTDAGDAPAKSKPLANDPDDVCRCGHTADHHADLRAACLYGMSARHLDPITKRFVSGACDCKRFQSRKRAKSKSTPAVMRPAAAVDWYRGPPEIVRRKLGGWYLITPTRFAGYIANAKIVGYNTVLKRVHSPFAQSSPKIAQRLMAGDANTRKAHAYRVVAMLEAAKVAERGAPKSVAIVRVGSPRLRDDDNMIPSCKKLRDAVAEVFEIDDCRFNRDTGDIPLRYEQRTAGARKAFAIMIELTW